MSELYKKIGKNLSERIRPDCEAAPWVVNEVKELEQKLSIAVEALEAITQMNHRDQGAVHGNVVPTTVLLATALSIASESLEKIRGEG